MARHEVDISAVDTSVGVAPENDGIMMMFIMAVTTAGFALNKLYQLTSIDDLAALDIDATYDATNNLDVYGQVTDFFNQANPGAILWLVGVATNTTYTAYAATATPGNLIKQTGVDTSGNPNPLMRAKIVGFVYSPALVLQSATDFLADVATAIPAIHAMQQALFNTGCQISCLLDGNSMSSTATPSTLGTLATQDNFSVSLIITGIRPNGVGAVGAALGRFARITVGTGVGKVADGALYAQTAYLTNCLSLTAGEDVVTGHNYTVMGGPTATITYNAVVYSFGQSFTAVVGHATFTATNGGYAVDNITPIAQIPGTEIYGLQDADFGNLGDRQYMFMRTWQTKAGLFWNDAATATSEAKAFSSQEYNRVVNKLSFEALSFFIEDQGDNLPVDKSTGSVAQGWLNNQQAMFTDDYIDPLNDQGGTGDISDATLVVTGPNFLATKKLLFSLTIVPTVILGTVVGTVQFSSTL